MVKITQSQKVSLQNNKKFPQVTNTNKTKKFCQVTNTNIYMEE